MSYLAQPTVVVRNTYAFHLFLSFALSVSWRSLRLVALPLFSFLSLFSFCPFFLLAVMGSSSVILCLFLQAAMGCEDCVSALLEHGASALCRESRGRTPLHLASSCGHMELLRSLLQGATSTDPLDSLLDYSGYTPAHWAAYHGETRLHGGATNNSQSIGFG